MYRRVLILFVCVTAVLLSRAQQGLSYEEVNVKSYALYEKQSWKELLQYGRMAVEAKQDFPMLRLRMGYAAFMLENFSEALKQYQAVLTNDSYNQTAIYYSWLCRKYLNQHELASLYLQRFSKEDLQKEKKTPLAITSVGLESSYKFTDHVRRDNSLYARIDLGIQLGWRIHMQQSVALFNQTMAEPLLQTVVNNNKIDIRQKEYYNRLTIDLSRQLQLKAAYHYLYTPFNNYIYNNQVGMAGIRYYGNYFDIQGNLFFSKLNGADLNQYDLQLALYPHGNMNLYFISTAMMQSGTKTQFNFKQVIGAKMSSKIWLEANATLGNFSNLLENDGLYVYNAIDPNRFKGGLTAYVPLTKSCQLQMGYSFEQRQFYLRNTTFNQHSITGGLSWKF